MLKRAKLLLLGISLLSLAIVLGGCGFQITPPGVNAPNVTSPGNTPAQTPDAVSRPMTAITLYYADKEARHLIAEVHKVDSDKIKEHPARTALEMLLAGTKNPNLVNVIPPGTKLNGLVVKNGTAYVDFNKNLKNNNAGSTEEIFIVGSIVNTLTEFPSINNVQFLIDGKKIATIAGHLDVSEPLGRSENIIKK